LVSHLWISDSNLRSQGFAEPLKKKSRLLLTLVCEKLNNRNLARKQEYPQKRDVRLGVIGRAP
jgi:hypothetical protein